MEMRIVCASNVTTSKGFLMYFHITVETSSTLNSLQDEVDSALLLAKRDEYGHVCLCVCVCVCLEHPGFQNVPLKVVCISTQNLIPIILIWGQLITQTCAKHFIW